MEERELRAAVDRSAHELTQETEQVQEDIEQMERQLAEAAAVVVHNSD
jgi:hypothetical protein